MSTFLSQGYWGQSTFTIPSSFDTIGKDALKDCRSLEKLVIPGTVKLVDSGAFRNCVNLREVVLEEGIQFLQWDLFSGCEQLHSITVPDSVSFVGVDTFRGVPNLKEPVMNPSKTTFFSYPQSLRETKVIIPHGVKTIGAQAFWGYSALEEVILPDTLEIIGKGAFHSSGLKSIVLPESVKCVSENAFYNCRRLTQADIRCDPAGIQAGAFAKCLSLRLPCDSPSQYIEAMRLQGEPLFAIPKMPKPPTDALESDPRFLEYAAGCLMGKQDAMEQMADYFREKQQDDHPFYLLAEHFWRLRLYYLGNQKAKQWLFDWLEEHPRQRIPVAARLPLPAGDGRVLRALGFLFFAPYREYYIRDPDKDGIVEVSSFKYEDGPDEDGYGRETYYDWWYMTENLAMVPGGGCVYSCTDGDRLADPQRFRKQHDYVLETSKNHPELVEQEIQSLLGRAAR